MRHCRPSIRRALPHTRDHIRGCTGSRICGVYCVGTYCKSISIQSIFTSERMSRLSRCCNSHQLPEQCRKQGPRVRALHRLRPRWYLEREIPVQLLSSPWSGAALGADVGTASHRPSQQLISRTRSPSKWDILSETDYTNARQHRVAIDCTATATVINYDLQHRPRASNLTDRNA